MFHPDCRYALFGLLSIGLTAFLLFMRQGHTQVLTSGLRSDEAQQCVWSSSYSQFAQDAYIARNVFPIQNKKGAGEWATTGIYVELGAYHPLRYSNTALFDKCYGWKGLCIDMNPFYRSEFEAQRTCDFVHTCVGNRSWADYYLRDNELGDGKEGVSRVACESFAAVLGRHAIRRIDLLSIDIEGAEMEALRSFPFESVHVEVMLVETWRTGKAAVFDFLEDRGYVHKAELGPDDLFVWSGRRPWLPPRTAEWRSAVRLAAKNENNLHSE
jgi:hypothetical protein